MKPSSRVRPRTIVGAWLLAGILGDDDERSQMGARLNGGESKWVKFDEPAVVEVACWLAVRRLLPADADKAQISALATDMRSKNRSDNVPGQDVAEDIIRAALGDQNVSLDRVSTNTLFIAQGFAVGYAYFRLGMDEETIVRLIVEAEKIAFKQGWDPALATA